MPDIVLYILAAVVGGGVCFIVPTFFGGRRPYGVAADVIVGVVITTGLAIVENIWLLDAFGLGGMPEWLKIAALIGDPLGGALVVLWIMRKIKPPEPERE